VARQRSCLWIFLSMAILGTRSSSHVCGRRNRQMKAQLPLWIRLLLVIENGSGVAAKVFLKFAEVAACNDSDFPACHAGSVRSSLLAVMPQVIEIDNKASSRTELPLEKQKDGRPVWVLVVRSDVMEVLQSMTLAGAIRTDLLDVYETSQCALCQGSCAKVRVARPRSQQHGQGHDQGRKQLSRVVAKYFISGRCGQAQRAKHEAAVLIAIRPHTNAVSFHGIFASESETGKSWTILLGYCVGGDLSTAEVWEVRNIDSQATRRKHAECACTHTSPCGASLTPWTVPWFHGKHRGGENTPEHLHLRSYAPK